MKRFSLGALCFLAAGCNSIFALDPGRLGDGAADAPGKDAGSEIGPDAAVAGSDSGPDRGPLTPGCQGIAGPTPVNIENKFCVDSTEVTNDQYAAFVHAVMPADVTQPAACQWNTTFMPPLDTWPPAAGTGNLPVIRVDYCDAWSYCNWAGKRLCGRVGFKTAAFDDVLSGELFYACSGGAANLTYSYGNTYDSTACDTDNGPGQVRIDDVGSNPRCVSAVYSGLFDLSADLEVWLDMCEVDNSTLDGSADTCRLSTPLYGDLTCGVSTNYLGRSFSSYMGGIRCCSDVD